jgi:hypothetical protein
MKTAIDIKEYLESQTSLTDVFDDRIKVLIRIEAGDEGGNLTDTYKECEICSMAYISFNDEEPRKYLMIG